MALRYQALATLRLPWPNQKRGAAIVAAHAAGRSVPSVAEANKAEPMLLSPGAARPAVELGVGVDSLLAWAPAELAGGQACGELGSSNGGSSSSCDDGEDARSAAALGPLLQLYASERYLLTWEAGAARVLLWADAGPLDLLRAMYQAALLDRALQSHGPAGRAAAEQGQQGQHPPEGAAKADAAGHGRQRQLQQVASAVDLGRSLVAMQAAFPGFEDQARAQGWALERTVLLSGPTRLQRE